MKFFEKRKPTSGESFTLSSNLTVSGHLEGLVSGRIEGIVKGNVKILGKIIIAESGTVYGNVSGTDVKVFGNVEGDIVATESITIGPNGNVGGNITSVSIKIDQLAKVVGNIRKIQSNDKFENFESAPAKVTADGQSAIVVKTDMLKKAEKSKDGWW
jgi:hypothetical protein